MFDYKDMFSDGQLRRLRAVKAKKYQGRVEPSRAIKAQKMWGKLNDSTKAKIRLGSSTDLYI